MADISSFLIPLPPLNEQKRIVEALDNVVASIMRN
jgi:restriction endonuclease S subunit